MPHLHYLDLDAKGGWDLHDWLDFCETKSNPVRKYRQSLEIALVSELLSPSQNDIILDAGIGYGRFSRFLARHGAYNVGVDISSSMLRFCKNEFGNSIRLIKADFRILPFRENTFSHILCNGVFVHNNHAEMALVELCRVLKPGGTIVLSGNNILSPIAWFALIVYKIRRALSPYINYMPMFYRTPFYYKKALRKGNCNITEVRADTLMAVDFYNINTKKSTAPPALWVNVAKIIDKSFNFFPFKYFGWEIWIKAVKNSDRKTN